MKINSTNRINRRYLLIEGDWKAVEETILDYVGILGWAKAAPLLVKEKEGKLILAISRESLNDIRASFELTNRDLAIKRVSGTLKGLNFE
jgi:RNase P/RNase MRP subunit POP5